MKENLRLKSNTYNMVHTARYMVLTLLTCLLVCSTGIAQRISFGLYATDGLELTKGIPHELNFNDKQRIILVGSTVTINLADETAAVLTLTGRADLDVIVTIVAPTTLDLDVNNKIPLAIGFAYSNLGATTESQAKTQAVQVPAGFASASFPLLRRASGPPGPPPTPGHAGYTAPTATAYLFIYGTLGPVPQNAAAGFYTGEINIYVEYAKSD